MTDPMQVGKVELQKAACHNPNWQEIPEPAPPKPPKRVAVRGFGLEGDPYIVANDGTVWKGTYERKEGEWHLQWTRLPDLPQD